MGLSNFIKLESGVSPLIVAGSTFGDLPGLSVQTTRCLSYIPADSDSKIFLCLESNSELKSGAKTTMSLFFQRYWLKIESLEELTVVRDRIHTIKIAGTLTKGLQVTDQYLSTLGACSLQLEN